MRWWQSRDSCDSDAFARPRAPAGRAVRLQDCKVSTFGRALHRPDQVQAAWRAAARHWWQFAKVAKSRGFTSLHGGTSYGQIVILAC